MFRHIRPVATVGKKAAVFLATPMRFDSSSASKDYYAALGVTKAATKDEIKKAYRKRAMETHPDQGGNKDEFARVSEAYEVLSNAEKRQVYDQYGAEAVNGMNQGGGPGGMGGGMRSPDDVFAEFFRGFGGMGGMGGGRQEQTKVRDQEVSVRLTFEEMYSGVTKRVPVTRPSICGDCRGEGTKSQKPKEKCSRCGGSGQIVQQHRMGPGMVQQVVMPCDRCRGSGVFLNPDDMCSRCHGEGTKMATNEVTVQIPAGVPPNVVFAVQGEGGTAPGAMPGDLLVHIEVQRHPIFERKGSDLIMEHTLTMSEAVLGFERSVKLLDGRVVTLKSPTDGSVVKHNGVMKLMGEGFPTSPGSPTRGDLYVITKIEMPQKVSKQQQEAIEKAFGSPRREASGGQAAHLKPLKETKEQFEKSKEDSWSQDAEQQQQGARRGGRRTRGGGMPGGQAECVQQ